MESVIASFTAAYGHNADVNVQDKCMKKKSLKMRRSVEVETGDEKCCSRRRRGRNKEVSGKEEILIQPAPALFCVINMYVSDDCVPI